MVSRAPLWLSTGLSSRYLQELRSVVTRVTCDGTFIDHFVEHLLLDLPLKEIIQSVQVPTLMGKLFAHVFLCHQAV